MQYIMSIIAVFVIILSGFSIMISPLVGKGNWDLFLVHRAVARPVTRWVTGTVRSIGRAVWRGAHASWRGAIATGQPWPARILLVIPAVAFGILGICFSVIEAFLPQQRRRRN